MTTAPDLFSLELPQAWVRFDPRADDIVAAIASSVEGPGSEHIELLVAPLAVKLRQLSAGADIMLAGFFADQFRVEGEDLPFLMSAQVMLALSPQVGGLDRLRDVLGEGGVDVEPFDMPAGAGLAVRGQADVDDDGVVGPHKAYLRRYFVPVPALSRVAALSFMTPNVELAEEFDGLFDSIARTLAFE